MASSIIRSILSHTLSATIGAEVGLGFHEILALGAAMGASTAMRNSFAIVFEGILIHIGNTNRDTDGCILVGRNTKVGKVLESGVTFRALYAKLKDAKGYIFITIE